MKNIKTKHNDLAQSKLESLSLSIALLAIYKTVTKHIKQAIKNLTFVILCIFLFGAQTTFGQNKTDIIIGSQFIIKSSILNEERTCLISIPDSYNDSTEVAKKYPIIILLDGYTHFKTASGIVHFMSSNRNRNNLMPENIIRDRKC